MNEATPYPPPEPSADGPAANAAQLKADYESGRTGDKAAAGDPGASPLGTDDEAGGASPGGAEIAQARTHEIRPKASAEHDPSLVNNASGRRPGARVGLLLGFAAALVLIALLAAVLL